MTTISAFLRLRMQITKSKRPALFARLSALPPKERALELLRLAELGSLVAQTAIVDPQSLAATGGAPATPIASHGDSPPQADRAASPQDPGQGLLVGMTSTASVMDFEFTE